MGISVLDKSGYIHIGDKDAYPRYEFEPLLLSPSCVWMSWKVLRASHPGVDKDPGLGHKR